MLGFTYEDEYLVLVVVICLMKRFFNLHAGKACFNTLIYGDRGKGGKSVTAGQRRRDIEVVGRENRAIRNQAFLTVVRGRSVNTGGNARAVSSRLKARVV